MTFLQKFNELGASLLGPFYAAFNMLATASDFNVACQLPVQAANLKNRLNSEAGRSDVVYTLINAPVEGFFQGKDTALHNKLWEAGMALW